MWVNKTEVVYVELFVHCKGKIEKQLSRSTSSLLKGEERGEMTVVYVCMLKINFDMPLGPPACQAKAKLPKLILPKFYDVTTSTGFWDSFKSAVHENQSLSKIN